MTNIEIKLTANFDKANQSLEEFTRLIEFLTQGEPTEAVKWMISNPKTLQRAASFETFGIKEAYMNDYVVGLQTMITQPI